MTNDAWCGLYRYKSMWTITNVNSDVDANAWCGNQKAVQSKTNRPIANMSGSGEGGPKWTSLNRLGLLHGGPRIAVHRQTGRRTWLKHYLPAQLLTLLSEGWEVAKVAAEIVAVLQFVLVKAFQVVRTCELWVLFSHSGWTLQKFILIFQTPIITLPKGSC